MTLILGEVGTYLLERAVKTPRDVVLEGYTHPGVGGEALRSRGRGKIASGLAWNASLQSETFFLTSRCSDTPWGVEAGHNPMLTGGQYVFPAAVQVGSGA